MDTQSIQPSDRLEPINHKQGRPSPWFSVALRVHFEPSIYFPVSIAPGPELEAVTRGITSPEAAALSATCGCRHLARACNGGRPMSVLRCAAACRGTNTTSRSNHRGPAGRSGGPSLGGVTVAFVRICIFAVILFPTLLTLERQERAAPGTGLEEPNPTPPQTAFPQSGDRSFWDIPWSCQSLGALHRAGIRASFGQGCILTSRPLHRTRRPA